MELIGDSKSDIRAVEFTLHEFKYVSNFVVGTL
jgi:hypothetical protein